jgi:hypothetical protein
MFSEPRTGATLKAWLPPFDQLQPVRGLVIVENPGVIVFKEGFQFVDRGPESNAQRTKSDTLRFTVRDTVYAFNWDSDGDGSGVWHLWFRGRPMTSQEFWVEQWSAQPDDKAIMTRIPATTYWVEVRRRTGESGWIIMDNAFAGVAPHYEDAPKRCSGLQ